MRCLRPVLKRFLSCQIKNLRILWDYNCSDLSVYVRRFLKDENFGSLNFFKLSEEISLSVSKFDKFTARSFNFQEKAKTVPCGSHENIYGAIGALRIRPNLVNLCHGEVGVCKN